MPSSPSFVVWRAHTHLHLKVIHENYDACTMERVERAMDDVQQRRNMGG
jgi:hypothetical protein